MPYRTPLFSSSAVRWQWIGLNQKRGEKQDKMEEEEEEKAQEKPENNENRKKED